MKDKIIIILIIAMGVAVFLIKGSLMKLFIAIAGLGMLISTFGEKIISRILMLIGFLGFAVFGIWSIVSLIGYLL